MARDAYAHTVMTFGVSIDPFKLIYSAKAWARYRIPLAYLDGLIEGRLHQKAGVSTKLPVEILEVIRHRLWGPAMAEATCRSWAFCGKELTWEHHPPNCCKDAKDYWSSQIACHTPASAQQDLGIDALMEHYKSENPKGLAPLDYRDQGLDFIHCYTFGLGHNRGRGLRGGPCEMLHCKMVTEYLDAYKLAIAIAGYQNEQDNQEDRECPHVCIVEQRGTTYFRAGDNLCWGENYFTAKSLSSKTVQAMAESGPYLEELVTRGILPTEADEQGGQASRGGLLVVDGGAARYHLVQTTYKYRG